MERLLGPPVVAGRLEERITEVMVPWGIEVQWRGGIRLVYNQQFSRSSKTQQYSYLVLLRPDIVLAVPQGRNAGFYLLEAKFKVQIEEGLGRDVLEGETSIEERRSRFKPEDLYKMHAYLDAIGQARSAWILYPGSELQFFGREASAIVSTSQSLPSIVRGVGAIPLKPDDEAQDALLHVLVHILDLPSIRNSHRLQAS